MINGSEKILVDVDETHPINSGGFGTIFAVRDDDSVLVKRIELSPPAVVGDANTYVAHIHTTRRRLVDAMHAKLAITRSPRSREFIERSTNQMLEALSTHWAFDHDKLALTSVWFRQNVAPGKALVELFAEPAPPPEVRVLIARGLVNRMETLRHAGLVHLDCVADNIFVDRDDLRVTLIDLDGCGIIRRDQGRDVDEWEHPPLTLGKPQIVRSPPWYPLPGSTFGPISGNFILAERWVVIGTVIRILSWNQCNMLGWLSVAERQALMRAYGTVCALATDLHDLAAWQDYCARAIQGLREACVKLECGGRRTVDDMCSECGQPFFGAVRDESLDLSTPCLEPFVELADRACLAPECLRPPGRRSLYDVFLEYLR